MSYETLSMGQFPSISAWLDSTRCDQVPGGQVEWDFMGSSPPRQGCVATGKTAPGVGRSMPRMAWCCPPPPGPPLPPPGRPLELLEKQWTAACRGTVIKRQSCTDTAPSIAVDMSERGCFKIGSYANERWAGKCWTTAWCCKGQPAQDDGKPEPSALQPVPEPASAGGIPWWVWVGGGSLVVWLLLRRRS